MRRMGGWGGAAWQQRRRYIIYFFVGGGANTLRHGIRAATRTPSDATPVEARRDGEANYGEVDEGLP